MGMRDNGCGCGKGDGRRAGNGRYAPMYTMENRGSFGGESVRREGGCGCGCGERQGRDLPCGCAGGADQPRMNYSAECCALMHRLQELDFALQETILYLDAYPNCGEAMSYYRKLVCEREQVAKEYERQCGPLTAMGNGDATEWKWGKSPWPWNPDFPGNAKR